MGLPKDFKEFIGSLNSNGVEYVIVGAYARAYYGVPRFTGDIDLFVRGSYENASRIERALEQFGFASLGLQAADFQQPGRVVQLGVAPNRIDLLTSLTGLTFEEVWTERVPDTLDGIPVAFISRKQFILNKRAAGRPKDLADLAALGEAVD